MVLTFVRFEELYVLLLTRRSTTTTGNEVRLQLRVSKTCKQYHLQLDLVAKHRSPALRVELYFDDGTGTEKNGLEFDIFALQSLGGNGP